MLRASLKKAIGASKAKYYMSLLIDWASYRLDKICFTSTPTKS